MLLPTHVEAYNRAQADQLSGQALIKQAFAYLLKIPADRLIMRSGRITESQFTYGQYIQLSQAGRPVIQPLPLGTNLDIPVVMRAEDIQPAFEALEQSLNPNSESLHDHAVYLSAKELIDKYKANSDQPISELLGSLSFRFSKTGYTGLPFSPANALCAQLAWLAVDKTKRNPQEQFWKLLIPEVTGTFQVMADAQWPAYGEALLDENLVSGRPGEIINYRLFYEETQSKHELIRFDAKISESLRDRIKAFHTGHFGFWSGELAESQAPEFNNYYEFFISLMDFTFRNSRKRLGDNFEFNILARSDIEFYQDYAQGLARYLARHENLDITSKRMAESILCPLGKNGLIEIIKNLSSKNDTDRCLNSNSEKFKTLFEGNTDIENYLKEIPFNLIMPDESLTGQDSLDYLWAHCLYIEKLDFDGLIHELKQGKNLPLPALASRLIALPTRRSRAEDLFNFMVYINDQKTEIALLKELTNNQRFPNYMLTNYYTFEHVLRIYERQGMITERNALLERILSSINRSEGMMQESMKKEFMLSLINASHRDIVSLKLLRKIEDALCIEIKPHHYINSCRNYPQEINAALEYFDKKEKQKYTQLNDLIEFFEKLSEPKQKISFNYYKQDFINLINHFLDLNITITELPELGQELYEALKEKIAQKINDPFALHQTIKGFTEEQRVDFCSIVFKNHEANPMFSSASELNEFINTYFTYIEHICFALKPFIQQVVKNHDDYLKVKKDFRENHANDVCLIFKDTFDKSIEIFNLLVQPDPGFIITIYHSQEYILRLHYTTPLLQQSWKLACILDKDERIKQTYQAVLEARGINASPEEGSESPRLGAVRKIFL